MSITPILDVYLSFVLQLDVLFFREVVWLREQQIDYVCYGLRSFLILCWHGKVILITYKMPSNSSTSKGGNDYSYYALSGPKGVGILWRVIHLSQLKLCPTLQCLCVVEKRVFLSLLCITNTDKTLFASTLKQFYWTFPVRRSSVGIHFSNKVDFLCYGMLNVMIILLYFRGCVRHYYGGHSFICHLDECW